MSEEDDDRDELRSEWLRHGFTERLRNYAVKAERLQLAELMGACAKSSDPEVRAQYERYVERKATVVVFERGGKK